MIKILSTRRSCNRFSLCAGSDLALRRRGFLSSSVFSPLNLSPLLWLRADQGVYTGGARQFYSADKGQLAIADNAALSVTTQDFTIGIWAYLDSTSLSWIVSKGGGGAAGYSIYAASGAVYAEIKTAAGSNILITGPAISTSAWHFITAEFDRDGNGTIYVDNVAGTPISISANSGSIDEAGAFSLGAYHLNTFNFAGRLSRAFKLDRLLTTAERTWLYNSGNGRVYGELGVAATDGSDLLTSLSAYWNLNETSGTANAIDQHSTNDLVPTFAELLSNGGFETAGAGGADVFGSWTESVGGDGTVVDDTVSMDAGAHCCKLTSGGSYPTNWSRVYQQTGVVGHRYTYSVRAKSDAASADSLKLYYGSAPTYLEIVTTTSYQTFTGTVTASTDDYWIFQNGAAVARTTYIDSASLVAVDIPAADGPSSDIASDSIGTNHGTLVNFASSATSWSSDRPTPIAALVDGSLEFDGTNDYVKCGTAVTESATFSSSAWIYSDNVAAAYGSIIGYQMDWSGYAGGSILLMKAAKLGVINFEGGTTQEVLSTANITQSTWTHVVVTVSGTTLKFYINGALDSTHTLSNAVQYGGTGRTDIGGGYGGLLSGFFDGKISDARIFSTALTLADIQALYAGTNYTTGIIDRWKLDDGPQAGLVDGDPVVRWTSIEGGYHDFEQATASKRPLYRASAINSQPGIDFDGLDDLFVKASAFLTGTVGTVAIVYRLDAVPNANQCLIASSDEATAGKFISLFGRGVGAYPQLGYYRNGVDLLRGSTTVNVDTDYTALFQNNGSALTAKLNGDTQTITVVTGSNNGDWWGDIADRDNVTIGAWKSSVGESYQFNGKICEVLVYSTELTAAEITSLDSYIFARYGIHV